MYICISYADCILALYVSRTKIHCRSLAGFSHFSVFCHLFHIPPEILKIGIKRKLKKMPLSFPPIWPENIGMGTNYRPCLEFISWLLDILPMTRQLWPVVYWIDLVPTKQPQSTTHCLHSGGLPSSGLCGLHGWHPLHKLHVGQSKRGMRTLIVFLIIFQMHTTQV